MMPLSKIFGINHGISTFISSTTHRYLERPSCAMIDLKDADMIVLAHQLFCAARHPWPNLAYESILGCKSMYHGSYEAFIQ